MPRPLKDLRPDASPRHRFGAAVRDWRLLRELSQEALGARALLSGSKIGKIEVGSRRTFEDQAHALDAALEADGALVALWQWMDSEERRSVPDRPNVLNEHGGEIDWVDDFGLAASSARAMWQADAAGDAALGDRPWVRILADLSRTAWQRSPLRYEAGPSVDGEPFADAAALRSMASTFDDLDRRFGGGYSRRYVATFLADKVAPRITTALSAPNGTEWVSSAARLINVAGFMAFDDGASGLAQRYFAQALRLAAAANDPVLGAHILSDMAMQAVHVGHVAEALAFAELGRSTAVRAGSWATAARCSAMAMRAEARRRDSAAMWRVASETEAMLARAEWSEEPEQIRFFTHEQFCVEVVYAGASVNDRQTVLRFLPGSPLTDRTRQQVLMSSTAASLLLDPASGSPDVELGCRLVTEVQPHLMTLSSARTWTVLGQVRRRLEPFANVRAVRECQEALAEPPIAGTP